MIVQTFDNGWGPEWPAKQVELTVVDQVLSTLAHDSSRTVIINSTWYTTEYHQQVLEWLRCNPVSHIVLVAMIDAAIPNPDWYSEFNCEIIGLGYYPGPTEIDFWALVLNQYHTPIDINILTDANKIQHAYMCLNRKPHWHRKRLYQQLENLNLLNSGLVSMGGIRTLPGDSTQDNLAPNAGIDQYGIGNDLVSLGLLDNWTSSFLNIVTETVFDINQNHFVSEKIYKPIVGCRPFLVYDPDGASCWLTSRGFKTFNNDFKDISNLDLTNPDNIALFLKELCLQPKEYFQTKFIALKDKIMYNKLHFAEYIQSQQNIINKGTQCQV
jgi:hypothetical protein